MKYLLRYGVTALIAVVVGLGFVWYMTPEPPQPPPKIIYAVYMFLGDTHSTSVQASFCAATAGGVFHFNAIDHPKGWAYFSLRNLAFGLCLDEEIPELPMSF